MNLPEAITLKTHQGPHFAHNEDMVMFDPDKGLFAVIDGVGGDGRGREAAKIVIDRVKSFYGKLSEDPELTLPFFYRPEYMPEANSLANAVLLAQKDLFDSNLILPSKRRRFCSAFVGVFGENLMFFCHIGQGELLRHDSSGIELLSQNLDLERALNIKCSDFSMPVYPLGLSESLQMEILQVPMVKGSRYLFLSDGIGRKIQMNELDYFLNKHDLSDRQKVSTLFALSNQRGNVDNQSALMLRF